MKQFTALVLLLVCALNISAAPPSEQSVTTSYSDVATSLAQKSEIPKQRLAKDRDAAAVTNISVRKLAAASLPSKLETLKPAGKAVQAKGEISLAVKATRAEGSVSITEGFYITKDFVSGGDELNNVVTITKSTTTPGEISISNFYGLEQTIKASVDTITGAITIQPQRVYQTKQYGDAYIYPVTLSNGQVQFYPDGEVKGSVGKDGVISLNTWGVIVKGGSYDKYVLAVIDHSTLHPSNGLMTAVRLAQGAESNIKYPLLVEQPTPATIKIYNFGSTGLPVTARVQADGTVSVSPQFMINILLYGNFYCMPVNNGSIDGTSPIIGRYDAASNSIEFQEWMIACLTQQGVSALWLKRSTATVDKTLQIKLPESQTLSLQGDGTSQSPYLLKSAKELLALAEASQTNSFTDKYFRIDADIDMAEIADYLPIGCAAAVFNGVLDGNNHTISNLSLDAIGYSFQGLIGAAGPNAIIKNIHLKNCNIKGSGYYLGAIVGYLQGKVENCSFNGFMNTSAANVGGLVGRSYGKVSGCSSSGKVHGYGYVGGIVGYSFGEISDCNSDADVLMPAITVNNYACVGGIVGLAQSQSYDKEGKLSGLRFSGRVTNASTYGFSGGISGYTYYCDMNDCLNTGTVQSTYPYGVDVQTGGVTGVFRYSVMRNCMNAGTVYASNPSVGAGGLVGYITTVYSNMDGIIEPCDMQYSLNVGQVVATKKSATSGIFGQEFLSVVCTDKPSDKGIKNVYTDLQVCDVNDPRFGTTTKQLLGTLPQGFDATHWQASSGMYPVLKKFAGNTDCEVAASAVLFADGESTRMMKTAATLSKGNGVEWKFIDADKLADTGRAIRIKSGEAIELLNEYATDTLVAVSKGIPTGRWLAICAVPRHFEGEGTKENPYLIKDKSDFMKLHNAVLNYDHRGDFFKQTADVDFEVSSDFQGVASGNHTLEFNGNFDGSNFRIKNLKIDSFRENEAGKAGVGSYYYGGLFHILGEQGSIRNVVIDPSCQFNFYGYSAPVVGQNRGVVENCRNYADALGHLSQTGGIVGNNAATGRITDCYNAGNIRNVTDNAGGIAGQSLGEIQNSQNDGNITAGGKYTGGIVAASSGVVKGCLNSGIVTGNDYTGGIIGYLVGDTSPGALIDCLSTGFVKSQAETCGALVGSSSNRGVTERNFYDASINNINGCSNFSQGLIGIASSELVSETAPQGMDTNLYQLKGDRYPTLKKFADEVASIANGGMFVRFDKGEKLNNIVSSPALAADSRVTWALAKGDIFKIEDKRLVCVPLENKVATDTLTAVWDGGKYQKVFAIKAVPAILEGKGNAENPFLIKSAADITLLSEFMVSSGMDYEGYYFGMVNDIEYASDVVFKPIAQTGAQFKGTFNGNGHIVSGINFSNEATASKNLALFGVVGAKGVVHDVNMAGYIKGYSQVGAVAALLYGKVFNCKSSMNLNAKSGTVGGVVGRIYDGGSVENCEFTGTVNNDYVIATSNVGGMAGTVDLGGYIGNCVNRGTIGNHDLTLATPTGSSYAGGIAGVNYGEIASCENFGKIRGKQYLGGIAGRVGKDAKISFCTNNGDIPFAISYCGGITGQNVAGGAMKISDCINKGNLSGKGATAGIIGAIANGVEVTRCVNEGVISGVGSSAYYIAGIAAQMTGTAANPAIVQYCQNRGDVDSEAQSLGGIVGKMSTNCYILDCSNLGSVIGHKPTISNSDNGVGGIVGSSCGIIERVWNAGEVTSNIPSLGGIVGTGAMPVGKITHAVNLGTVTLTRSAEETVVSGKKGYGTAGIYGGYGPVEITECYNLGTISAPDYVAGINAAMWTNGNGPAKITSCYNAGQIVATGEQPTKVAHIAMVGEDASVDGSLLSVVNSFYQADMCNGATVSTFGISRALREMADIELPATFNRRKWCYPTLSFVDSVPQAMVQSVMVVPSGSDVMPNLTKPFMVGIMPGITWTSSDNISIADDGTASILAAGNAWVKASAIVNDVTAEKEWKFAVGSSAVADIVAKEVKSVRYYDLNGAVISRPAKSQVVVIVKTFADGTQTITKEVIK